MHVNEIYLTLALRAGLKMFHIARRMPLELTGYAHLLSASERCGCLIVWIGKTCEYSE
jgi:hypothetical protein